MNRDKKLGLALGVLLVGIVAAFFYRNDRATEPKAPRLENPQSLDDRIAERPNVPYLTGVESDDVVRNTSHARNTSRRETDLEPDLGKPTPFGQESHGAADVPDPIPAFSETRIPEGNREWTPVKPERAERTVRTPPAERTPVAAADGILHEVRPGDTLSAISAKYLGSSTRFQEVYEANRDQLRSPNDVRVGMKLRIPRKVESTASERGPARPRTSSDERTPPARDRRAERDDRDRSGASLMPINSDRETADRSNDRTPSKPSVPTRTISSSPPDEDLPFGQPGDSVTRDSTPSADETGDATPAHLFRPTRKSPLTPGAKETPAERASGGQRLGQRLPEDLPDLDEPVVKSRTQPASSEPTGNAEGPRKSASEFLKDAASPTARPAKPVSSAADLEPGRYLVLRGDTLEKIALRLLGDKSAAPRILEANRDILRSLDDVREGMSLRIPR